MHAETDAYSLETIRRSINVIFCWVKLAMKRLAFHGYSLWLFTASDIKTIVVPSLAFGVTNALAIEKYGARRPGHNSAKDVIWRTPFIILWIWMNLLPFTINNQKAPDAIEEDKINKPWRALPTERLTPRDAERLMVVFYILAGGLALMIGGTKQSLGLLILGIWYNNFSGSDSSCLLRNLINAYGYVCFTSGALEVAVGFPILLEPRLVQWLCILAAIIFTTVHLQDMYDQAGDRARGRKTVPLVAGDGPARWTIFMAMLFWGIVCPCYWDAGQRIMFLHILLACTVGVRSILLRTVESDQLTFKIWIAWVTLVFVLPLGPG
ncbi:MAG: hypothetical protein Q9195_003014 [Heterodermia aff. obscurata]